jgi:hypothetical protein
MRARTAAVVAVCATAGLALFPAGGGAERATTRGVFNVNCFFSHRAQVDPIVSPGGQSAHPHDFAGNVGTDAFSTPDSLRAGVTNCEAYSPKTGRRGDQAGYWFPTLYVNDRPVAPRRVTAYYQSGFRDTSRIVPYPPGLKMVAGDASGAVDYRPLGAGFNCSTTVVRGTRTVAPTCAPGTVFVGNIRFPDCWNGIDDDSPDHLGHMAYSRFVDSLVGYRCPPSHPVLVPQLVVENLYDTEAGPSTRLASGDISTWHVDFMNGWTMEKLTQLVNDCLVPDLYCGGRQQPVSP